MICRVDVDHDFQNEEAAVLRPRLLGGWMVTADYMLMPRFWAFFGGAISPVGMGL